MARLSKRKKRKPQAVEQPKQPMSKKHEYFLLGFILLNIVILFFGFQSMDLPNLGMYLLLILSLISIYAKRKYTLPERIEYYLDLFGTGAIGIAFVLFIYVTYQTFTK